MQYLKTNTATRVTVGPFLDVTNGYTPEIALTATNEHLTFVVDNAGVPTLVLDAAATASDGDNDLVHITSDAAGYYDLELTAAQVDYLGRAKLSINYGTDHLPVFQDYMIVPANVYDSMVLGTDYQEVDVKAVNGSTTAAINQALSHVAIVVGTAVTGSLSTTIFTTNIGGTYTIDDSLNGRAILFTGGNLVGQAQTISSYTASGGSITVAGPFTEAPANTDAFIIL